MIRTVLLVVLMAPSCWAGLQFTDVTAAAGLTHRHKDRGPEDDQERKVGGAAPGDYDGDGWVDVYALRLDGPNVLYRNRGDGTFEDVTEVVFGPDHLVGKKSSGCGWADLDNDGDLDLYVTSLYVDGLTPTTGYDLFINDGAGGFTEEAALRGVAVLGSGTNVGNSVAFGDYDLDGWLDLHVTEWRWDDDRLLPGNLQNNRLFRNRGAVQPGFFDDVTAAAGVATDGVGGSEAALDSTGYSSRFCDLDRDGHPDLLVVADAYRSRLFWNNGDGTFTDGTAAAGVGTDRNGMGSAVGDYDNDGDLDWFVTSIDSEFSALDFFTGNRLYRYDGNRGFTERQEEAGVLDGGWGWGASFCDYDHDGDLDLFQTNGYVDIPFKDDETRLFENDGTGVFIDVAGPSTGVEDDDQGKALFSFDYDRDGDMDVFIVNNAAKPVLYRNDTTGGDWLQVRLRGRQSNRQGIGAFLTVERGGGAVPLVREMSGGASFLGHDEHVVHFGLGSLPAATAGSLVVEWPSGVSQTVPNPAKNSVLDLVEPPLTAVLVRDGAGFALSWNSCRGRRYDLESCVDLASGVWTRHGVTLEATAAETTVVLPVPVTSGFWRVVARP